jgi:hypothetical protein
LRNIYRTEIFEHEADMQNETEIDAQLDALNASWLQLARSGQFERAWRVSDEASALRSQVDCTRWPRHQQFIWRGQSLRGERVLIRCYHGLGDTIQFARFIPRARAVAREVVLWAQPPLIPLLQTMRNGAHRVLPLHDGAPDVAYDVDLELFELMHALRVSIDEVALEYPYLLRDLPPENISPSPVRIGLVWQSGEWDEKRSIPPEWLAPLGGLDGIEWLLFQRGPGLARWPHSFGSAPAMKGIMDEALAMRQLDLLISVDTCSAHLAGALGVPVWTLLPREADWRWMNDRVDTPWYPSMRLVRQRVQGDWSSVIAEVMASLAGALAQR